MIGNPTLTVTDESRYTLFFSNIDEFQSKKEVVSGLLTSMNIEFKVTKYYDIPLGA